MKAKIRIKAPKDYGISSDKMHMDSQRYENLEESLPFTLKADDFISFAELDLKGSSDKDIVNALSNIKRAIENRMDCIFFAFNYYELSKAWNFPEKVEKLNNLGIISPRILTKINRIRNLLEHQYQIPKRQEVLEAYDVAILFLAYSKNFLKKFIDYATFYTDDPQVYVKFKFQKNRVKMGIDGSEYYIKAKNPIYDDWVRLIIECFY